jgi:hypothetical protein
MQEFGEERREVRGGICSMHIEIKHLVSAK